MNAAIYATILTGLGIVITLIVTMRNLAKANQQETNRRIDELKKDLRKLLDARFKVIDPQFKVVDSQFEVAGVRFQKLEGEVVEVRQGVQDIKKVIFKPAA
jgi:RNase H-fold protein (predicted Holliday junction resolvase)